MRRCDDAWENCFHLVHDLEANGFFVDLATAARDIAGEGLYHWAGEATCRAVYRERQSPIAPDGWGRYLTPGGDVTFFLEWDRGSESPQRLRAKVGGYLDHYADKADALLNNVLFVAPGPTRAGSIREVIRPLQKRALGSCNFWITDAELLGAEGPLGPVWSDSSGASGLLRLPELPHKPKSDRPAGASIGKPHWWEARPAGGEGA